MSEFLMVVPPGWREIPNPDQITGEDSWRQFMKWDVTEVLKTNGFIAEDDSEEVSDFRVFLDGNVLRLWVMVVPHVIG